MKGSGNNLRTLCRKLYFMLLPTSGMRSRFINKHKQLFRHVGSGLFFQPRLFPSDPELISFGNNVMIASDVVFINHDIISAMLNKKYKTLIFRPYGGGIAIGDNVMIGAGCILLPNVRIGSNVIIAAGSIVTKDIPDGTIAGGVPAKVIGSFDAFVAKRKDEKISTRDGAESVWAAFNKERGSSF